MLPRMADDEKLFHFKEGLRDNTKREVTCKNLHTLSETIHLATQLEQAKEGFANINYLKHKKPDNFNNKFASIKINDNKTSYASKTGNYKKEKKYKTQGNKVEHKSFDKNKQKPKIHPTALCNRCKRKGHYANNFYLDNSGPKNICSIKGLVDKKLMKLGLDCGATNSIMNNMTAINNNIEILRSELKIRTANSIVSEISGITRPIEVNISGHKCNMQFLVFDHEDHDVLLGLGCGIFPSQGFLEFKNDIS
ncbi:unnamed protein product, partial [Brachionus calyciflorus]